ncbi:MAG TPA: Fe-S cluster assembly ATPase SufC [Candidatus Acetothermia bacterium]|nr:Fe-S cluster assembly ATPase SufC [Candidatus Acetothermia bacterium]
MRALEVVDLVVSVEGKRILEGVSFALEEGRIHVLMGPNGSGKSTLAFTIAGHPDYVVESGRILLAGEDITALPAYERARRGLFLGFQYPPEVEGVKLREFLRLAAAHCQEPFCEFQKIFQESLVYFRMEELGNRELNVGFSGGEKKRAELLQMRVLRPRVALLDEPDSGVDVDGLRLIAAGIEEAARSGTAVLLITHYPRILEHLPPAKVFVLDGGRIVREGGPELAREIERTGYGAVR